MAIHTFQRVEKKYQMNKEQYEAFVSELSSHTVLDEYGLHTIRNIYYDTDDYELIRTSIEKPKYKEKFRVRAYGEVTKNSVVYLEIKKKFDGIVYKRRFSLPYMEAINYLEKKIPPENPNHIFKEIDYFLNFYKPVPKLYLAYDRTAYIGINEPELRITIDHDIRSRQCDLSFENDQNCEYLDSNLYLMEIKVPNACPLWLTELLCRLNIYPNSFSKYGTIYKILLLNEELE